MTLKHSTSLLAERPSWMEIDLGALAHNYAAIRALVGPDIDIMPALKGDAYGHGAALVAAELARHDVKYLALGSAADARSVRDNQVNVPIVLFGGPLPAGLASLIDSGFTPTVYDLATARAVSDSATGPAKAFVKVDIGMGRLGVLVDEAQSFIERIARLENLVIGGLYTHATFHDAAGRDWARGRINAFDELLIQLEAAGFDIPITQALASTGLLTGSTSRANTVCPGAMLYGLCPVDPALCDFSTYRPVLAGIKSRIIHIGSSSRYGVIPLGAADGMRRPTPGEKATVLIGGQRASILGVSLEYTNIDLSGSPEASVGTEVIIVGNSEGESITLEQLAAHWHTDPLHALMSFSGRIPRVTVGGSGNGP